jgi:hypothetical protein
MTGQNEPLLFMNCTLTHVNIKLHCNSSYYENDFHISLCSNSFSYCYLYIDWQWQKQVSMTHVWLFAMDSLSVHRTFKFLLPLKTLSRRHPPSGNQKDCQICFADRVLTHRTHDCERAQFYFERVIFMTVPFSTLRRALTTAPQKWFRGRRCRLKQTERWQRLYERKTDSHSPLLDRVDEHDNHQYRAQPDFTAPQVESWIGPHGHPHFKTKSCYW